jgi:hypothetical protein
LHANELFTKTAFLQNDEEISVIGYAVLLYEHDGIGIGLCLV